MSIPAPHGWFLVEEGPEGTSPIEHRVVAISDDGSVLADYNDVGFLRRLDEDSGLHHSEWLSYGTESHPVDLMPAPADTYGHLIGGEQVPAHFLGCADGRWHAYAFDPESDYGLVRLMTLEETKIRRITDAAT